MSETKQFPVFCPNCGQSQGLFRSPKPDFSCKSCNLIFRLKEGGEGVELTISTTMSEAFNEQGYPDLFCPFCGGKEKLFLPNEENRDLQCPTCSRTFFVEYF